MKNKEKNQINLIRDKRHLTCRKNYIYAPNKSFKVHETKIDKNVRKNRQAHHCCQISKPFSQKLSK